MAYQVYLRHKDRHGNVKHQAVASFLSLNYRNTVRTEGSMTAEFRGDDPVIRALEDFDLFEVWMRNQELGIPWHMDSAQIYRRRQLDTNRNGQDFATISCLGQISILSYRQVAWPAGITNRSRFADVPAETIAKTIVTYNCTAQASVANGRLREGDMGPGMGMTINVAPDLGRGVMLSRSFANGNLLRIIQETLAPVAGGDFSLTPTGPGTWLFDFHPGQLGEDKTSGPGKVEFALTRGNLLEPRLMDDATNEATVVIVGGQGEGGSRMYAVVTGPGYAPDRDIEMFYNAANEPELEGLIAAGQAEMERRRRVREFTFQVIQTGSVFYSRVPVVGKRTYREGDIVSVVYAGEQIRRKVTAVEVDVRQSTIEPVVGVRIETEDV